MSVLIKTMEMPKNCGECQFCHTENFTQWCCPTGREDILYDAIPDWCPLEKPKTGECSGCKFIGSYDTDFPCVNCVRKTKDYYCGERMRGEDGEE